MQFAQMMTRRNLPSIINCLRCRFGRNSRFVRRLEWLTLCPKVLCLPQISQCPPTTGLLHVMLASFRAGPADGGAMAMCAIAVDAEQIGNKKAPAKVDGATSTPYATTS